MEFKELKSILKRLFREYEAVCKHGGIFLDADDVQDIKDNRE